MQPMYQFSEVEAKKAKPQKFGDIIRDVLRADNDACYIAMERYLRGAANTGSSQFDHAYAVGVLMEHDKLHGGLLHIAVKEKSMTEKELWDRLSRLLVKTGFQFHHGRLTGLAYEGESNEPDGETEGETEGAAEAA